MRHKRNQKHAVILTTILTLLMLAGCASTETEAVTEEPTVQVEVNEVQRETEEVTVEELTEVETTEEVEQPEVVIPEGVDLESDLPGEEWLMSFSTKISEPVAVVYNDVTGRKEVIQQDSVVYVNTKEDYIAIAYPKGYEVTKDNNIASNYVIQTETYAIYFFDSELALQMGTQVPEIVVSGEKEWTLEFFLRPEE